MLPRSISASAAADFELCPAMYMAKHMNRGIEIKNPAANLGTVCHEAFRRWIEEGYYQDPAMQGMVGTVQMTLLVEEEYRKYFNSPDYLKDAKALAIKWLARQDWGNFKVLSTEKKGEIPLHAVHNGMRVEVPFRFIRDRVDLLKDGSVRVVDYKSIRIPVQPADLLHMPQALAYAWVTSLEHPKATRIWVQFDLLRYDSVGIAFEPEDIERAKRYFEELLQRVVESDGTQETPNQWCRSCLRKNTCSTLQGIVKNLGQLNPLTGSPEEAIHEWVKMNAAQGYIKSRMEELEAILKTTIENSEDGEFTSDGYRASLRRTRRRSIDLDEMRQVLPPEWWQRIGTLQLGDLDDLLKTNLVDAETKSLIQQAISWRHGKASLKVEKA